MNLLFDQVVVNLDLLYNLGYFISLLLPFLLLLLIARFRGFFASIFFLPFFFGLMAFLVKLPEVSKFLTDLGPFGEGALGGMLASSTYFMLGHVQLIELILQGNTNKTLCDVLRADWFMFVPYLVLFIIFFAIFHKRKRRNQDEDYF